MHMTLKKILESTHFGDSGFDQGVYPNVYHKNALCSVSKKKKACFPPTLNDN